MAAFNCDLVIDETVLDFGAVKSRVFNLLRFSSSFEPNAQHLAALSDFNQQAASPVGGLLFRYFMPELQVGKAAAAGCLFRIQLLVLVCNRCSKVESTLSATWTSHSSNTAKHSWLIARLCVSTN